ncbi:MAG: RNA polymerase sigma factor [Candidatus Sumerlaeaceae bacterium]
MIEAISKRPLWNLLAMAGRMEVEHDDQAEADSAAAVFDDPNRFLEIYHAYYNRILNYHYRRAGNHDIALDLTSRTFLAAFEALRQRKVRNLQLRPWLYRLATNAHLDHCRREQRWTVRIPIVGRYFDSRPARLPDAALMKQSESDAIRAAMFRLDERYRSPLVLRYYEELSYADIGKVLGMREVSARSRVSRALKMLQSLLEESS